MSRNGPTASWQKRNCYEDVSERRRDMTRQRLAAGPAGWGHRALGAGWPTSSTEGVVQCLDVETGSYSFDDERTLLKRGTP